MAKTLQKTVELAGKVRRSPARSGTQRCPGPQELSRLELECMKAIWLEGATTVAEVRQRLWPSRPLAYTTVLTVLDRLAKKRAVTRTKQGKAYVYSTVLSFEDSRDESLRELLEFYFQGSADKLIEYLRSRDQPAGQSGKTADQPEPSPGLQDCLL
jgi:predicted transcriptional regulator